MNNSSQKNLIPSTKSKPVKLLWNIGPHIVCIIDKNIVEKLKIDEGDICEQQITEDGYIVIKIRRF